MNKLFALMGIITMLAGFAMLVGAGMQSSAHAAPGDITLQFTEFINAETGDPLCLGIAQHQGANTGEVFLLLATDADCNPPAPYTDGNACAACFIHRWQFVSDRPDLRRRA